LGVSCIAARQGIAKYPPSHCGSDNQDVNSTLFDSKFEEVMMLTKLFRISRKLDALGERCDL